MDYNLPEPGLSKFIIRSERDSQTVWSKPNRRVDSNWDDPKQPLIIERMPTQAAVWGAGDQWDATVQSIFSLNFTVKRHIFFMMSPQSEKLLWYTLVFDKLTSKSKPCGKMVVPHLDQREINAGSSAGSELFQPVKPLTTGLLFHGTL